MYIVDTGYGVGRARGGESFAAMLTTHHSSRVLPNKVGRTMDEGYGSAGILAGSDERGECVAGIVGFRIFGLLQPR